MQEHLDDTLFANQTPSILILIFVTLFIVGILKGFFEHRLAGCCGGALTLVLSLTPPTRLPCSPSRFCSPILLNL